MQNSLKNEIRLQHTPGLDANARVHHVRRVRQVCCDSSIAYIPEQRRQQQRKSGQEQHSGTQIVFRRHREAKAKQHTQCDHHQSSLIALLCACACLFGHTAESRARIDYV